MVPEAGDVLASGFLAYGYDSLYPLIQNGRPSATRGYRQSLLYVCGFDLKAIDADLPGGASCIQPVLLTTSGQSGHKNN